MEARSETIAAIAVLTIAAYDRHVEQLFQTVRRLTQALAQAGIDYRIVGGVAVFLHVSEQDPLAARSTRDVDIAVDRSFRPSPRPSGRSASRIATRPGWTCW